MPNYRKTLNLKDADSDVRIAIEAVPLLHDRTLDYSRKTAHFRLRNDNDSIGSIVLQRKQLLKLRDWINDLEMYG